MEKDKEFQKLSFSQKQVVQEFQMVTTSDIKTAISICKGQKWNLEQAMDHFYNNCYVEPRETTDKNQVEKMFKSYMDKESGDMLGDGITKFCHDLGIDVLDPIVLIIAYHFKVEQMGKFTKTEFVAGMGNLHCDTLAKLKGKLPEFRRTCGDLKLLKPAYNYIFTFAKDPGGRNMDFNLALQLWNVLFTKKTCPYIRDWITFMEGQEKKMNVTKDLWNMFLEFTLATNGKIENFVDDGCWPNLIDEFVKYLNVK